MVLRNAFAGMALEHANEMGNAHLVAGTKIKWRREFNVVNSTYWDVASPVAGITIPDPVSGTITVNMGTTINAESWMVSKQIFTIPVKIAVGLQLSQKIANNEVYIELVGCDAQGVIDETRVAAWRIAGSDSTTNTVARSEVRNGAAARRQSGNLTTVAQTGGVAIMEVTAESDEIWFSSKLADNTAARTVSTVMNLVAPDPEGLYKLRIRFKNGSTAPASATTVTLQFALAVDYTEQQVEVTGGNGNSQAGQSIPVSVVNGGGVSQPIIAASASGTGLNIGKVISAASTNATLLKSTAGRVYGYQLSNTTAAWKFFKLHNLTTAPTVGTSAVAMVIAIPPNLSVAVEQTVPITFSTGISYSITNAYADNDTTAVAAGDVIGTVLWI